MLSSRPERQRGQTTAATRVLLVPGEGNVDVADTRVSAVFV
jgi:hypothetical protein